MNMKIVGVSICFASALVAQPQGLVPAGVATKQLAGGLWRFDRVTARQQLPAFWERVLAQFSWNRKAGQALPFNRSVGFLVGVARYKTLKPALYFVDADLTKLRNFLLTDGGFDTVFELRNENVHKSLVEEYMVKTFTKESADLGSQDRFLFYYSGHGADQFGLGYLQFFGAVAGDFLDDVVQATAVRDWARINVAKHVLVILDACASGMALQPKVAGIDAANSLSGDPSGLLLTAGLGDQRAWQVQLNSKQGYSVFTHYLLQGLTEGLDEKRPFVNIIEIFGRAKDGVAQFRSDEGVVMDPQWGQLSRRYENAKGTFVFLNPKGKQPEIPNSLKGTIVAKGENEGASLQTIASPETRVTVNPIDELAYVYIPTGTFRRGCVPSDRDCNTGRQELNLPAFWIGQTEVTVEAYERYARPGGMGMPEPPAFNPTWHDKKQPVVKITHSEAAAFCDRSGGVLPDTDQWERAARGGVDDLRLPWGNSVARLQANYGRDQCCGGEVNGADHWEFVAPVGSFPPNRFQLFDMIGNVAEWTRSPARLGQSLGVEKGGSPERYIVRGGSWSTPAARLRTSANEILIGTAVAHDVGFRCVIPTLP